MQAEQLLCVSLPGRRKHSQIVPNSCELETRVLVLSGVQGRYLMSLASGVSLYWFILWDAFNNASNLYLTL